MDIKPTKSVKGKSLENIVTKTNFQAMGINFLNEVEKDSMNTERDEEVNEGKKENPRINLSINTCVLIGIRTLSIIYVFFVVLPI